jgi:hypothetical protein
VYNINKDNIKFLNIKVNNKIIKISNNNIRKNNNNNNNKVNNLYNIFIKKLENQKILEKWNIFNQFLILIIT